VKREGNGINDVGIDLDKLMLMGRRPRSPWAAFGQRALLSRAVVGQRALPGGRKPLPLGQRALSQLAPSDPINEWIRDPNLTSPAGLFGGPRMWVMLRVLPGLNLPEFLAGTRMAYGAVTRLMYARDWIALEPLVSAEMLAAMQETMDQFGGEGRRVVDAEDEDAIVVQSAVLREVHVLADQEAVGPSGRRCHLDVLIRSHEKWSLFDYHQQEAIPPYDGRVRTQETTWRFEGVVSGPEEEGSGAYGEGQRAGESGERPQGEAEDEGASSNWTVQSIVA